MISQRTIKKYFNDLYSFINKYKFILIIIVITICLLSNIKEGFTHGNQIIIPNNLLSFYTDKQYPNKIKVRQFKENIKPNELSDPPYFSEFENLPVDNNRLNNLNNLNSNLSSTEIRDINRKLEKINEYLKIVIDDRNTQEDDDNDNNNEGQ